jgi:hypothetical protein
LKARAVAARAAGHSNRRTDRSDGTASRGCDAGAVVGVPFVLGEEPGAIVAGFDVHRRRITGSVAGGVGAARARQRAGRKLGAAAPQLGDHLRGYEQRCAVVAVVVETVVALLIAGVRRVRGRRVEQCVGPIRVA